MKLAQIVAQLEQFCPLTFAEDWDNSGLQVGSGEAEVQVVMLALDATGHVVEQAVQKGVDLLLTHHPLLYKPLSHVTGSDFVGKRVLRMAARGIAAYAMHTNFDVLGMADAAADALKLVDREVLMVTFEDEVAREGIGRIGKLSTYMTLEELAGQVKEAFGVSEVRVYGAPSQTVVTAALLPGSGGGELDLAVKAGADVMITGDISHHTGLDALEKGIAVIDAGHYGIEKLFIPYMAEYLRREMPELTVLKAEETEPFWVK